MNKGYNLRKRIMFRKKKAFDGPVMPLDEYEDYKKIYADVRYLRSRGLYAARSANIKTDAELIIRYREDIDETMRVVLGGKEYNIDGIIPLDNVKGFLSITVYEIKYDM